MMKKHHFQHPAPFDRVPPMLAMDIGSGTKDVLLFSPDRPLENNVKIVAPTPSRVFAETLEAWKSDLAIHGRTIGGGFLSFVLEAHATAGRTVTMTPEAALTLRSDLDQVRAIGITVQESVPQPTHRFEEVELATYLTILDRLHAGAEQIKLIGIAVQDHGQYAGEQSARRTRFQYLHDILKEHEQLIQALVFDRYDLPEVFLRLRSCLNSVHQERPDLDIVLCDTAVAAILGCFLDPRVQALHGPTLHINVGNGHVMVCILHNHRVQAFYEHHTRLLAKNWSSFPDHLQRLAAGTLTFDEVFASEGHGCATFSPTAWSDLGGIVVTGPQRGLLRELDLGPTIEAAPGGDMMMTGPLGLAFGYALKTQRGRR